MSGAALVAPRALRPSYVAALGVAFALFGTLRIVSYLPTLWAIHASADSSQHSLWTWGIWLGSHLTMAAWMYEQSAHRVDRAVALSLCNAAMCTAACALIAWYRWV
jgi:hypothetical protein